MAPDARTEVAIVGGGPSGAALAARLAGAGRDVVLFERWPRPRWRAAGVYSSPLTRARLADLGIGEAALGALIRPIEAMEVVSMRGARCRLAYDPPACGVDRVRLEQALLDVARAAGATVVEGAPVRRIEPAADPSRGGTRVVVSTPDGSASWLARVVVGADGPGSLVGRAFGVERPARRLRRAGLTGHRVADLPTGAAATMILGDGWYCGIAPVPAGRVNIGLVMSERSLRRRLAAGAAPAGVVRDVLRALPAPHASLARARETDEVAVALPLAHRPRRIAGAGFVLVGDAAGFVDPLTGEGLHRALVSAELAADALGSHRAARGDALERYARRMHARFAPKDVLSWLLQLFLARPAALDYALRRLGTRAAVRSTFAEVMADLVPARVALEPRYLARLLAP